jgi:hypothetical protein
VRDRQRETVGAGTTGRINKSKIGDVALARTLVNMPRNARLNRLAGDKTLNVSAKLRLFWAEARAGSSAMC